MLPTSILLLPSYRSRLYNRTHFQKRALCKCKHACLCFDLNANGYTGIVLLCFRKKNAMSAFQ